MANRAACADLLAQLEVCLQPLLPPILLSHTHTHTVSSAPPASSADSCRGKTAIRPTWHCLRYGVRSSFLPAPPRSHLRVYVCVCTSVVSLDMAEREGIAAGRGR
jgi:hypothetical protein